jgi:hypothetical protein
MHAMAQPLTVVQAGLEAILFRGATLEDYKQATEDWLSDMSRSIELLAYVRELIRIHSAAEAVKPVPLGASIDAAVEDLRKVFDDKQVRLWSRMADRNVAVSGSPQHVRQVFFYILQAAQSCANAGDVVSLQAYCLLDGQFVEAKVKITAAAGAKQASVDDPGLSIQETGAKNALAQPVQPQVARSLALAEAIVFRQRGELEWVRAPFAVRLRLPIADGENNGQISRLPSQQAQTRCLPGSQ